MRSELRFDGAALLTWGIIFGLIVGFVSYRASREKTSASLPLFLMSGVLGGWIGSFLGVSLVTGAYVSQSKMLAGTVIGAIGGAALLTWTMRILKPPRKSDD